MQQQPVLLLEPFSGISGNMFLGAGIALGFPPEKLEENLRKVPLSPFPDLICEKTIKTGIESTYFNVEGEEKASHHHHTHPHTPHHHHHHHTRSAQEILTLLQNSSLSERVKKDASAIFQLIAEAEAAIHGKTVKEVHFHEVGAVDSIVDVIGAALVIEYFNPTALYSHPINTGSGFIKCDHGTYPVPAPATAILLQGIPTYSKGNFEMTTPTGAAIAKYFVTSFSPPPLTIHSSGYGAGTKEGEEIPNVLRLSIGINEKIQPGKTLPREKEENLLLLEASIDDMNPQNYELVMEKCFQEGALDVTLTSIQMKKNRPAVLLSVLCSPEKSRSLREVIYLHTTTIGIRETPCKRYALSRTEGVRETPYGKVRYKTVTLPDGNTRSKPEYDDCLRIAKEKNMPLQKLSEELNRRETT